MSNGKTREQNGPTIRTANTDKGRREGARQG